MSQLFESKSVLAKLLAQENLIVEHRKVSTAYFDLKNRTIILPQWKEMDGVLYDLLMGHEVGHGLFTPAKGWHDAVVANTAIKSYLNVVEDARIERMIKDKYPGLRRSFNLAYKSLYERDFFGLNGLDVTKLRLIDRINVFYKLGAYVNVAFTQEELKYIDRINAAETWDDVETIALELYTKAVEEKKNTPEPDSDNELDEELTDGLDYDDSEDSEESDDFDYSDDTDDTDESEDANEPFNKPKDLKDASGNDDEESNSGDIGDDNQKLPYEEDVESLTDKAFRNNEKNLVENSQGETRVLNLPKYSRESYFIPHKLVYEKIRSHFANRIKTQNTTYRPYSFNYLHDNSNLYVELMKRTTPVVNYMVKEFEMRKNASQLARVKVGKSGKINPKKLSRFNLDQDIFQRVMSVPEGKNHGLVLFIDLSGSMQSLIQKTFEQAVLLTMFCKKVNIPFEVYGFSDHYNKSQYEISKEPMYKPTNGDLLCHTPNMHIKQYLSSTMSSTQYRAAVNDMLLVGKIHKDYDNYGYMPPTEHLYGTPLDEAIIASIDLVSEFKQGYKLDMVNTIFLTDGLGSVTRQYVEDDKLRYAYGDDTIYVQHKETKYRVRMENKLKGSKNDDGFTSTRALIELAKKITGSKYTGYYITTSKRDMINFVYPYEFNHISYNATNTQKKSLLTRINSEGFYSCNYFGFDEYFFVLSENLKIEDNKLDVEAGAKKNVISKAFMKSLNSRGLQRMFLNKFVQNLAA